MDAAALSNLSRSEIISLAKANKIKGNLATKEMIRQLLRRFPDGVPHATQNAPSTPASTAKALVGRVKDAFKTITRRSRTASPVPDAPLPPSNPNQSSAEIGSTGTRIELLVITPGDLPPLAASGDPENPKEEAKAQDRSAIRVKMIAAPHVSMPPPAAPPGYWDSYEEDIEKEAKARRERDAAPPAALPPPPDLADPEDIKLLIQDMAGISARNKLYMKQAIAMRAQTLKIQEQAEELRIAFRVEQLRRERMEQYLKCWRATDPEWSYSAVWDGDITVAPVLARFDNAKASMVMDQEVSTSDDEALVDQWHVQHEAFAARKKAKQGKVVEPISDEEFESDEEEFYSPFVLRPDEDDGTASDSECQVFPHFDLTSAILMNRPEPQIIVRQSGKRSLDTTVESDDDARYFPRARIEPATEDKGKAKMSLEELEDAEQLAWDRSVAEALGEEDVDENWEGLGGFRSGWRMDVYRA